MGRKNRYETHVKPRLDDIRKWILDLTEKQICERLGVSVVSFEKYKKENPELTEALKQGRQDLVVELKDTLKRKAKGYYYTETKTFIKHDGGREINTVEETRKYAQPDTGAIHLLLKNLDETWHNDDTITIELKRMQQQLDRERFKAQNWEAEALEWEQQQEKS